MTTVTRQEQNQVDKANASGKRPAVFVHGLWLLPASWDRWARFFENAGYAAVSPGWPDDPDTVGEARAHPDVMAGKSIEQVEYLTNETLFWLTALPARLCGTGMPIGWAMATYLAPPIMLAAFILVLRARPGHAYLRPVVAVGLVGGFLAACAWGWLVFAFSVMGECFA